MEDTRELLPVRIPATLKEELRSLSVRNRRSMTREIQVAIENHLARPLAQVNICAELAEK